MDIKNYIGETTEYDKKQEVEKRKVKNWLKSVSAFANGSGGYIIFGITDDDVPVGLSNVKEDSEFISQKIKERIDPIPQVVMKIVCIDDKNILFSMSMQEMTPRIIISAMEFLKPLSVSATNQLLPILQSISVLFYADTTLHLMQGQAKSRLVIIPSVSSEAVIMRGMGPVSMTSSFSRSAWSAGMEC